MPLWFAAFLGLVQGLTEFLPISSTAHLRIAPALLGQPDPGAAFTAVIQLGTLAACIAYFARDLFVTMPRAMLFDRKSPEARLPWLLILATLPIAVAGVLFKDYITGPLRSLYVVAGALAAVGILMIAVDRGKGGRRTLLDIGWADALAIGLAQTCALIPGVSRSGSTITCALLIGMARPDAARFSFLLSIPAVAGAGVFELKDALHDLGSSGWAALGVGTLTAAIFGYLSIGWLLRYLSRRSLGAFGVYRVVLALVLLGLVVGGAVSASG